MSLPGAESCDLCKKNPPAVRDLSVRFSPAELQRIGLSPETAQTLKLCRVCFESITENVR
jgi:hypothetical protein